jgi:hypothetical protein
MTRLLRTLLGKADTLPLRLFLWIDLGLAGFVALAHGGALLLVRAHPTADAAQIESIATISLPLSALIALSAVIGLAAVRTRKIVLSLHGIVFSVAAMIELVWGLSLILGGIPKGNFSWGAGMFSASICYAAFVFSRFCFPERLRAIAAIYYAPAIALGIAVPIDFGVFFRFIYQMADYVKF